MTSLKRLCSLLLIIASCASCITCVKSFRIKPEEIIEAANSKASSMINAASSEANAILANADEEASEIISEAERIKAEKAEAEAERIKAEKIAEAKAKAEAEAKKPKLSSPLNVSFPLQISDADRELLYRICNAEDGDAGTEAVQAVCWVILNRVASSQFPNTISGVVNQKGQFDPVTNGDINKTPYPSSIDAVDEVLAGNVPDPTNGALYFAMDHADNGSWWQSLTYCGHIGTHNFYR